MYNLDAVEEQMSVLPTGVEILHLIEEEILEEI
jgi:hypothetical protein